jgi:Ca2+-transporting ATPase
MDNGTPPEIPSIVTEDLSSTPAIHVDNHDESVSLTLPTTSSGHSRKPSDPTLLSPGILKPGRRSFDTTGDEDESRLIPPSPTLSTQSSVHFMNSTALRENKPGDGTSSLALLSPKDNSRSHSRRPSNATMASTDEGTVADHSPGFSHLYPATSNMTVSVRSAADTFHSTTPTHVGSSSDIGDPGERKQKHKKARKVKGTAEGTTVEEEGEEEDKQMELDLTQDENIDPTPFTFKPYHLASLVDPKSLETLEAMGGADALLAGLGVDPTNGLSIVGNRPESGDAPAVVVTEPGGEKGKVGEKSTREGAAYAGTVEDRQRIYGSNVLPARKSKSLWQLMWLALKDKVLVSLIHPSVH